ncbi:MAG: nucleoside 2-deoxyribosyltransferase domain-containing protein [bacterium]|nr:nucleoside 2-deoxyribosyltransferase domain-containing protein [bacterium]
MKKQSIGEGKDYLIDSLLNLGLVNAKQVAAAREAASDCRVGVVNWMLIHNIIQKDNIMHALAAHFGVKVVNLSEMKIDDEVIASVRRDIARNYRVVPVYKHGDALTIAIADPSDLAVVDSLEHLLNTEITWQVASGEDIEAALAKYYGKRKSKKIKMNKKLVFLDGTAANNNWRDGLIESLVGRGVSAETLFNPVVKDWNEEAQRCEEAAKTEASHLVFYIADPKQDGNPLSAYSMVEATMALYDKSNRTVVVFDTEGITGHPLKAMNQTLKVLKKRFPEANVFATRQEAIEWLASQLA